MGRNYGHFEYNSRTEETNYGTEEVSAILKNRIQEYSPLND